MIPIYEPHLRMPHKLAAIRQILSGWIGPGAAVERLATMLGNHHGRHCTVTNSGTSALLLAYMALELKPGATICCPDYGLPACQNAARLLGYKVQLIDVDPETGCMDPAALARHVSACDAVVFVDHNGYTGEALARVRVLCTEWKIPLIEDSAVALGCDRAGRFGDVSILSFSVPKIITTGQGGAVLASRDDVAARLASLVDQGGGWRSTRLHTAIGGNFRMADVQAALGVAQLRDLPALLKRRNRLWDWYRDGMEIAHDVEPSGWMVSTWAEDAKHADAIIKSVRAAGYDCKRLYRPIHHNTPYLDDDANFPGATDLYARLIYLPSSLRLTRRQVKEITAAVDSAKRSSLLSDGILKAIPMELTRQGWP